jgi:probable F420-dependent oxidoreductase
MKVGVAIPNFSTPATPATILEVARAAEALGYDSVWTTDHIMMPRGYDEPYGHIYEALIVLAYIASATQRVELGTSVIVLPPRNPVLIAKETASLDALSGGRLIFGIGAGWMEREFELLGSRFDDRGARFEEYVKAIREYWTADTPSFAGQYVSFSDVNVSPRPARPGGPPIWIGGSSRPALRRSATLADGWHPVGISVDAFRAGMARIRELAGGRGITGSLRIRTAVGRSLPEARSAQGAVQHTLAGEPEQIAGRIMAYADAGLEHLVAHFGDNTTDSILADMRRFAEEVRPALP